jgi:integrase/recombinase XerD
MSVILRKRKNADGSTTLRLDIYSNGQRTVETLKHLKLAKPSSALAREQNRQREQQAKEIAVARAAELEANNYSMVTDAGKKTIITVWMQSYVDSYTKKDKRNMQGALNRFAAFLAEDKKTGLMFGNLNALLIEDFIEYLEANSTGEGASSYYNRFKKMIKQAYRRKLLKDNILEFVERKVKGKAKKKDVLTLDELKVLSITATENGEVKKAFLFTCVTGLRWIDIKSLQWKHINIDARQMNLTQSKTNAEVTIPLNATAIKLLGEAGQPGNNVFDLPTANGANKTLKAWVKRAGIVKAITWHNGRHSFGTNLIFTGTDLLTTSKVMGHASLKHTYRYVDTADELKQTATNKLNF